jgi:hypothetical protein
MRRAQQQTITFSAVDSVAPPARKSGLSLLTTDIKISKDGGAFASATNSAVELGSTGRYSLVLSAAEADCNWIHIYVEKTGMQPQDIVGSMSDEPSGAVASNAGNNATAFATSLTSTVNDYWKDALLVFTTGSLAGQVKKIIGYTGATKFVTVAGTFTAVPAVGDSFLIINK